MDTCTVISRRTHEKGMNGILKGKKDFARIIHTQSTYKHPNLSQNKYLLLFWKKLTLVQKEISIIIPEKILTSVIENICCLSSLLIASVL
jgi:hypothetical protein